MSACATAGVSGLERPAPQTDLEVTPGDTDELTDDRFERAALEHAGTDMGTAIAAGCAIADHLGIESRNLDEETTITARIGGSVMVVARGIIVAVVALIVLGALYSTDIVSNPDNVNAWTNMTDTFADYGTTAFTLIGVGLIAVGAGVALSYFGGMGGGGR
ncbi:hypothetical protein C5B91_20175 [Haloferax sp. Atlit-10N]|uniref:hypothetical protein n=1 Tax=unclassified Haloferax TaxID=2625095 RepID=UPI000E230A69|nr:MULTISPECIES: hypothetical protein [unclassified Haloferax]RDZ39412.1 hypothetical protein C5B87_19435 [Haloferax sp. Atlit-16N]RDZ53927.1 hypothetical protein C5B91_20175 [Haloferax sp. Atlit-10N]